MSIQNYMIPPFFPRGDGPLVSILIPTRGRVEKLSDSIRNLLFLASIPNNIEFVLRVDDDDTETVDACKNLATLVPQLQYTVKKRGNGYWDLHEYYHQAAAIAKGDWLWIWNDDASVQTEGWDTVLLNYKPSINYSGIQNLCVLFPENTYYFPIVRKRMFDILGGRLCNHPYIDRWLWDNMNTLDLINLISIQVDHKLNNVRNGGIRADVYQEYEANLIWYELKREMLVDCKKIVDYMEFLI